MVPRASMRLLAIASLLAGLMAPAQASPRLANTSDAPPIAAWVTMCRLMAEECAFDPRERETIAATPENLELIAAVNAYVNRTIAPLTDMEHRGVVDRWEYPIEGRGDCEDFQLLKRKLLAEAGLPRRALLMTVVINPHGEGHAVLTVRVENEDLILDNQTDAVLRWDETGHTFIKREALTKTGWSFLAPEPGPAVVAAAAAE